MKVIFEQLDKAIQKKLDTVLVTVISSSGSTPRSEGARMLVSKNGRIAGTIGGGAVEFRSEQLAKEVLKTKMPRVEKFILAPNDIADLGMICGGNVNVLFQYLSYESVEITKVCRKILEYFLTNQQCWLISEIGEQPSNRLGIYNRKDGFFGQNLNFLEEYEFTEGVSSVTVNGRQFVIEDLLKLGKVYIFGGGHVAQALVPVLKRLDFYCVVVDDRAELLTTEYFPDADQFIIADLKNIKKVVLLTENDYAVIMTRGHQFDFELARQILETQTYYIGVMGSKRKVAVQIERLKECGFEIVEIERICMPIGLEIKAETPAELAISVAGELIIKRAEK